MDTEKEFLNIIIKAHERGLRIGQLFDNVRSILRFVGVDVFFISDAQLIEAMNRFLAGEHGQWQLQELQSQIIKLHEEIDALKEQKSLEEDSADELARYLRQLDSGGGTVGNPDIKVVSIL